MTALTIEQIHAEHERLGKLIAELSTKRAPPTILSIPAAEIVLQSGERYAGLILNADGTPSHHLVLLPGDGADISWSRATEWATETGGELPTRREQALLFANLKSEFQAAWYWSSESHESDGSYAWFQDFLSGIQGNTRKSYEGRARAVRRLTA